MANTGNYKLEESAILKTRLSARLREHEEEVKNLTAAIRALESNADLAALVEYLR